MKKRRRNGRIISSVMSTLLVMQPCLLSDVRAHSNIDQHIAEIEPENVNNPKKAEQKYKRIGIEI